MGSSEKSGSTEQNSILHNIDNKLNMISEELSELNNRINELYDEIVEIDLKLLDLDDVLSNTREIADDLNKLKSIVKRTYTIIHTLSYILLHKHVERLKDSYKAEKIKLGTRINDVYFDAVLESRDRIVLVLLKPYIDVKDVRYCSDGIKRIKQLVDKTRVDCVIVGLYITKKGLDAAKRNEVEVILIKELS